SLAWSVLSHEAAVEPPGPSEGCTPRRPFLGCRPDAPLDAHPARGDRRHPAARPWLRPADRRRRARRHPALLPVPALAAPPGPAARSLAGRARAAPLRTALVSVHIDGSGGGRPLPRRLPACGRAAERAAHGAPHARLPRLLPAPPGPRLARDRLGRPCRRARAAPRGASS